MLILVAVILYGVLFAIFSTQNTVPVQVKLGENMLSGVPLYMVVLGSLLMGTFLALVINLIESIPTTFALKSRENKIDQAAKRIDDQNIKIQELEMENAKLRDTQDYEQNAITPPPSEQPYYPEAQHKSLWGKIKDNFRSKDTHSPDGLRHI